MSTGHDGSFSLQAPPGDYWLTIQKGQFRLEQQIHVDASTINPVSYTHLTLPTSDLV